MAKGTVTVRLRRDWFGPDGTLYEVRGNPHSFPAEYANKPKDLSDEDILSGKTPSRGQRYAVLPSSAEVLETGGKTVAVLQQTASGYVEVAMAVDGDVKSVGGALDDKGVEQSSQSVAAAAKGAEELNIDLGANPRESGPLPAGAKPVKK